MADADPWAAYGRAPIVPQGAPPEVPSRETAAPTPTASPDSPDSGGWAAFGRAPIPVTDGAAQQTPPAPPSLTDPSTWQPPQDPAAQRIRDAASQAFTNAPSLGTRPGNMSVLTPETQDWVTRNIPVVGPYLINPLANLVGTGIGAVAAGGAAVGQTARELATQAGVPESLQRDVTMLNQVLPAAGAEASMLNTSKLMPTLEDAGPKYAGGVTPDAMQSVQARQAERAGAAPAAESPPAPSTPTGIGGPMSPPVTATAPTTVAEAKAIASAHFDNFDKAGDNLLPGDTANKFIEMVQRTAPQTAAGTAVGGETEVTKLMGRIEDLRDQPITFKAGQEIDEGLGDLINKQYGIKGLSKDGKSLLDIQDNFRDMVDGAAGPAGDALANGRKAWSQARKMADLEQIQTRANLTDNPDTAVRAGVRALLSNPRRARGYSPEEVTALQQAATRGVLGDALHVFGSRLIPIGAVIAGSTGGVVGGLAAAGAGYVGTSLIRGAATSLQAGRMQRAFTTLGSSVPPVSRNTLTP